MKEIRKKSTLYYIHDPMCSWCWGFRPCWLTICKNLRDKINIQYVLGGLAPDTDQEMPEEKQLTIRQTWEQIQQSIPGTEFNFNFWIECKPRRSTYPACRAIIAANNQNPFAGEKMLLAIQTAYYIQAKNPSDNQTLIELAEQIKLDTEQFSTDLISDETQLKLNKQLELRRKLQVYNFPSLVLETERQTVLLDLDYNNPLFILNQINEIIDQDNQ
ncbi:MAG: DsbA family protein [Gammaproteobacteria bacterium]|nr:DsbA family protein [Gammaproteobacteria bacterium]